MAKDNKDTAKNGTQAPTVTADETGAKAAELAATAVAAAVAQEEGTPDVVRPPPDAEVAKPAKKEEEDYPSDAPNEKEPTVPPLEEWLKRGYSEDGYYRRFGKNPTPNWTPPKESEEQQRQQNRSTVKPKFLGDVPVMCLKTETQCELGGRRYQLVKGREIMMDPNHVTELTDWVREIEVVS